MKRIILILPLFAISCAHSGKLTPTKYTDSNDLKRQLTAQASYPLMTTFKVTPLTTELLTLIESEKGAKNLDSKEQIQKNIDNTIADLAKNKTCFDIYMTRVGDIKLAHFRNWRFKIEQDGSLHEVLPRNTKGVESVPEISDAKREEWFNSTYACSATVIDTTKPFKFHILPQFDSEPERLVANFE